jgi:hypothetical protein
MSKFLLNLLLQISKALVNLKIQFSIQKSFSLTFGPTNFTGPLDLWPSQPRWPRCPRRLKPPSPVGVRFPFWFAAFDLVASPSSLCQAGPGCQLRPSPPAARARPRRHHLSATLRRPAPRLGCHRAVTTPPSFPPLIPLLNPLVFNGVKAINACVNPDQPSLALPRPYKNHPDDPWSTSHLTEPFYSPLPRRSPR